MKQPGPAVRGYELREQIGASAAGTAYHAYQPAVGREVAIKVIRPDLANDPACIRRFQAEAQVIATLEHPHIVPLYDYWREPDAAYLVMRLMRGGSLASVLEHGTFTSAQTMTMVDQLGNALQTAHRSASSTATSTRPTSCSTTTATPTSRIRVAVAPARFPPGRTSPASAFSSRRR